MEPVNKLQNEIEQIKSSFQNMLKDAKDRDGLQRLRTSFLSKKGEVGRLYQQLRDLSSEEKKIAGKNIQQLESFIEESIKKEENDLENFEKEEILKNEWMDVTLPSDLFNKRPVFDGHLSPISIFNNKIQDIFLSLGFTIADGPQVENEYFNFTALNIPETHPARDMQDTFWMTNGLLLRTHTSCIQARMIQKLKPPFRLIAPGRVFRNEATDASHENTFYQIEGFMVDKNISVANLIYFMKLLLSEIFEKEITIRLRPGYFPFVEPGFELDIQCLICHGKGCPVCKQVGWVELVPCGLVHPEVLKEGGVNPDVYSGFAFGLGLNRLAMMKLSIDDIRWFESGDLRFANQF
ncbi:MAG TPA: phenylalanine--tRNA ligase subunit alpha [Exilispira sp.]|nr:phenylalanine--tRNA ligase subunit alpha [Exilispira sp.]